MMINNLLQSFVCFSLLKHQSSFYQSPAVRRDALYFVFEQLEAFDDGGEGSESSERKRTQQLDAVASYAANALTKGPIPIDKIKIEVADYIVQ